MSLHVIFSLELFSPDSLCVLSCQVVIINISPPSGRNSLSIVRFVRGLVRSKVGVWSVLSSAEQCRLAVRGLAGR